MTQQPDLTEWDEDVTASTEDEYAALLRAISWAQGFSLLFVQCSPAEGERLIKRVQEDVAEKVVKVLPLEREIEDLYEVVATYPDIDKTDVLFITGLEKSLVSYIQPGFGSEGAYYAKDTVPKLLGKLNLQRERFKEDFAVCFVFLVPRYAMKYLIRRAADFFDWRSGVWEFVPPREEKQQVAQQILQEGGYKQYLSWTPQQRRQRVQEINDLLANAETLEVESSALHFEKGNILAADKQFEAALAAFDAVLALNPSSHEVFHNRGSVLSNLGRTEEALAAFNAALAIKPDKREALNNKGIALYRLGRYEEALAAFDATLAIKPDDDAALNNKGCVLADLGRYEETIALCDAALAINPDDHTALYNKGNALYRLSRYKEAMVTFDVVLAITPDKQTALNNKGNALSDLGHYEKALTAFDAALALEPDKYAALNNKGNALSDLGRYEEAIVVYDAALATTPDKHEVLKNKGNALAHLGRHEEAIALCDAALAIKPNDHQALYNKACCYSLQGKVELALENLSQAIQLNPSECCKRAQTDTDFDAIRDHPDFKALLAET
jgi:tetratricopeptide (TPR) repeat protein